MKGIVSSGKFLRFIAFLFLFLSCGTDPAVWVDILGQAANGFQRGMDQVHGTTSTPIYQPSQSTASSTRTATNTYGSQSNPIPLILSSYNTNSIYSNTPGGALWFRISVTTGNTYNVFLDDYDVSSSRLDCMIDASYQSGASIFSGVDTANPQPFTATSTGSVLLKVYPYSSGNTGNFRVMYARATVQSGSTQTTANTTPSATNTNGTQANPIPLTNNTYASGSITTSTTGRALWYSFSTTSGTSYNVFLDDYDVTSSRLDAVISAIYQGGADIFISEDIANPKQFTANRTGTVLLRVSPRSSGDTGSFRVAYVRAT